MDRWCQVRVGTYGGGWGEERVGGCSGSGCEGAGTLPGQVAGEQLKLNLVHHLVLWFFRLQMADLGTSRPP